MKKFSTLAVLCCPLFKMFQPSGLAARSDSGKQLPISGNYIPILIMGGEWTSSIVVTNYSGLPLEIPLNFYTKVTRPGNFVPAKVRENLMEEDTWICRCKGTSRSRS
jgi:hypothetical protein